MHPTSFAAKLAASRDCKRTLTSEFKRPNDLTGLDRLSLGRLDLDRGLSSGIAFLIAGALIPLLARLLNPRGNRFIIWFRLFYPQAYYLPFFQQAILLSNIIYRGRSLDGLLSSWEEALFGFQPAMEFYKALPSSRILVEAMFFAYFFFYVVYTAGIWLLYIRGRRRDAQIVFTLITTAFYLLYVTYIFLPVQGPKYFFPALNELWYSHFEGYLFTAMLTNAFNGVTLSGAAFPSAHATITVLMFLANLKYQKVLAYVTLPVTLTLLLSTVYIYAHYVLDIVAGILLALAFYRWLPTLCRFLDGIVGRFDAALGGALKLPTMK